MGSRDYAVLALASTTGLRACDVAGLALSDVDWRVPSISHVQRKTGNVVSLPLMPHVARAMADYVLGHRPDNGRAAVFLSEGPSHEALSAAGVRDVLYCYASR